MRRTKIVATLGPATDRPRQLDGLLRVGVDVVRLNFSHGSVEDHKARAARVRERARALGRCVGVLGDLQGPKIRIEKFAGGEVQLHNGATFVLDASLASDAGDKDRVGITYKSLPGEVERGDTLVLDDGRIVLKVTSVKGEKIHTRVMIGGVLSNNKGINKRGGGLIAPALTDKDRADIKTAAEIEVDYLAVSFPRDASDIETARRLLREAGGDGAICAKIERAEALDNIEEILQATDAIMIARGDLGVEIGDAELPAVQKRLISQARSANKVVITATQDFFYIIERFSALDLGANRTVATRFAQQSPRRFDIRRIARKRHRQIVDFDFGGRFNIRAILIGECGSDQTAAPFIDALVVGQYTPDHHPRVDFLAFHRGDLEYDAAVVQHQRIASLDLPGQGFVGDANAIFVARIAG